MAKVVAWIVMVMIGLVIGMFGANALFTYFAGFGFDQILKDLNDLQIGLNVDISRMAIHVWIALGMITIGSMFVAFFTIGRKKFVVSEDSVDFGGRTVKFDNIVRVNSDSSGLADKLLRKGTIVFELTGLDKQRMNIDFVDRPRDIARKVSDAINEYRMRIFASYADQNRMQRIVDSL